MCLLATASFSASMNTLDLCILKQFSSSVKYSFSCISVLSSTRFCEYLQINALFTLREHFTILNNSCSFRICINAYLDQGTGQNIIAPRLNELTSCLYK